MVEAFQNARFMLHSPKNIKAHVGMLCKTRQYAEYDFLYFNLK